MMSRPVHPFSMRRESLGLSLSDVQVHLSRQGFNYSVDMIRAFEQGERGFPIQNAGFVLAMSECLNMPVMSVRNAATSNQATRMFYQRVERLKPQNQYLLDFVLRHPTVTQVPGFNFWFELAKSVALRLPDDWFRKN